MAAADDTTLKNALTAALKTFNYAGTSSLALMLVNTVKTAGWTPPVVKPKPTTVDGATAHIDVR